MKAERNIFIAFILNLGFSIFEFFGGMITGSIAIISDAVHDMGDAASIGISYFLERKSKKGPDDIYTYGYTRYSVVGGIVTTLILLLGSFMVIYNAAGRILHPEPVNYNGMIALSIVGVMVNLVAAIVTRDGASINQKAVNLHMLEDVLGWIIVLFGAIVMRFTDFTLIDPIMSIGVAVFIICNALGNLSEALDLFLEKTPKGISVSQVKNRIMHINGVLDVHHIHIRSIDGRTNCATMHIVTNADPEGVKNAVRDKLLELGISHATLETETPWAQCKDTNCGIAFEKHTCCHHHHHHHS